MELARDIDPGSEAKRPLDEVAPDCFAFEAFRFYPGTFELFKNSKKIPLKVQSAKVLNMLVQKKGELVTREEIIHEIWSDRVVEFDLSLNACVRDIRTALGDDANTQHFIETLAKRGYRLNPKVAITEKINGRPRPGVLKPWLMAVALIVGGIFTYSGLQSESSKVAFLNPATPEQTEASRALVLSGVSAIYDGEVAKPQEAIFSFRKRW